MSAHAIHENYLVTSSYIDLYSNSESERLHLMDVQSKRWEFTTDRIQREPGPVAQDILRFSSNYESETNSHLMLQLARNITVATS